MIIQQSLWDEPEPAPLPTLPAPPTMSESKDAYECRRVLEMAAKLNWLAMRLEPIRTWTGVTISEGEQAWREFVASASCNVISLALLALCKVLNPLSPGCINEAGLWSVPVEVISRIEERDRARMMQLAEALEWPHVSYWDGGRTLVFGPGQQSWQQYCIYGSDGVIVEAIEAMERKIRGEPDKTKMNAKQSLQDDDDEE